MFVIGNGTAEENRSDALVLLKNGNLGLGTSNPNALLHVHGTSFGEGNILFEGDFKSFNPGGPPVEGAGTRMMWYPDKAAFRAGRVSGTGAVNWDKDSIGNYSFAWGWNNKASGNRATAWGGSTEASGSASTAWGVLTEASGYLSTAWGDNTEASGIYATSWGENTEASGFYSTSWGSDTEATGRNTTAWGDHTISPSGYETAFGRFNTLYAPVSSTGWNANDRLLVVGNGTSTIQRSDALVLLKNGNFGLGTSTPAERLDVVGNIHVSGDNRTIFNRTNHSLAFGTNNTERMRINASGTLTIGDAGAGDLVNIRSESEQSALRVTVGNTTRFRIYGTGGVGVGSNMGTNPPQAGYLAVSQGVTIGTTDPAIFQLRLSENSAAKPTSGSWTIFSDERLKKNVHTINNSLEKVLSLRGVTYQWIDPSSQDNMDGTYTGMIAQEVEKVFPEWIREDEKGLKTLTVIGFEGIMVEALRELKEEKDTEIEQLRKEKDNEINSLASRIEELERLMHGFARIAD